MKKEYQLEKQGVLSLYTGKAEIEFFDEVLSTNVTAAQSEVQTNTVFIAKRQSGGKGRFDRKFYSREGGIYLSYLYKENLPLNEIKFVTPCAAVAVAKTLEKRGFSPKIKWVNDIYLNSKKICGILSESKISSSGASSVIVGIGINVNTESFPCELADKASSLFLESGKKYDLNGFVADLISVLDDLYDEIRRKTFLEEYRRRSLINGKTLLFKGKEYVCLGIDDDARLILQNADEQLRFSVGEVSISANGYVYDVN